MYMYMYMYIAYIAFAWCLLLDVVCAETGKWSVPSQNGVPFEGRLDHSSVYDAETGLIYVFGGMSVQESSELLTYDPVQHTWLERTR